MLECDLRTPPITHGRHTTLTSKFLQVLEPKCICHLDYFTPTPSLHLSNPPSLFPQLEHPKPQHRSSLSTSRHQQPPTCPRPASSSRSFPPKCATRSTSSPSSLTATTSNCVRHARPARLFLSPAGRCTLKPRGFTSKLTETTGRSENSTCASLRKDRHHTSLRVTPGF